MDIYYARWLKPSFIILLVFAALFSGCAPVQVADTAATPAVTTTNPAFDRIMLSLINNARRTGRQCGDSWFPAAAPVRWDDRLAQAAERHASDMAANEFVGHRGTDGARGGDRVLSQGFPVARWGENVAAGQPSPRDVVHGWLNSPGHCKTIMLGEFEFLGAAVATMPNSLFERYWTMVMARPHPRHDMGQRQEHAELRSPRR